MGRPHTRRLVAAATLASILVAGAQAADTEWSRIDHPSFGGGDTRVFVNGLVPARDGGPWLAVGHLARPDGGRVPTVWTSADGRRWTRSEAGPSRGLPGRDRLFHPARRGNVGVAFGMTAQGGPTETPAVWRSVDNGPWQHVPEADAVFGLPLDTLVESVEAHSEGFVAVGGRVRSDGAGALGIWRSADGVSWTADDDPNLVAPRGEVLVGRASVARGSTVVVTGERGSRDLDGGIWTFRPATGWRRVSAPGLLGPGTQQVADVVVHRGRFVAIGPSVWGKRHRPTAWISADGLRWRRVQMSNYPGEGTATELAVSGGRIYAAGVVSRFVQVWSSSDGTRWRSERLPAELYRLRDLELPVLIAATRTTRLVSPRPAARSALWLQSGTKWQNAMRDADAFPPPRAVVSISSLAHNGSTFVAFSNPWLTDPATPDNTSNARAWTSPDARVWTPLDAKIFRQAEVSDVTALGTAFVAVGTALRGGAPRAVAWRSENGRDWSEVRVVKGPVRAHMAGVAFDGARLVALATELGAGSNRITVWRSGDGRSWTRERELMRGFVGAQSVCADASSTVAVVIKAINATRFATVISERTAGGAWRGGPAIPDLLASDCAVSGATAAVVGQYDGNAGVLFRSAPANWGSRFGAPELEFTAPGRVLHAVTATPGGYVAVGGDVADGQHDLGVWFSSDGWAWTALQRPVLREPGVQVGTAVVQRGGALVVGGVHASGAAVWIGTP